MAGVTAEKVEQLEVRQRVVEALYGRLDAEWLSIEATRTRAMNSPAQDAEGRGARDAELARLEGALARLQTAEASLCFGRIDRSTGESLHIGRVGMRSASGEVLLVDWCGGAARAFYAATPAAPCGLRRRRHLRLLGRRVVDISDEILDGTAATAADVIGDGPLIAALTGARTGRMRQAAATLQREQDEVVRSEHRGVLVVDGGPGTGKTMVALHRAAYVLYAFPEVSQRGVLVFGPNRRFLEFISRVLPSLGEDDVELATTPALVGTEATRPEPDAVARTEGRRSFGEALARTVLEQQPHGVPLQLTDDLVGIIAAAQRVPALTCASFGDKTVVVPAPDARGLEFDTVIIVDPAEIEAESDAGLQDLYVAQTRATKQLITLTPTHTAQAAPPAEPCRDREQQCTTAPGPADRQQGARG